MSRLREKEKGKNHFLEKNHKAFGNVISQFGILALEKKLFERYTYQ